jgi:rRNA maturation endonuclease Nob1
MYCTHCGQFLPRPERVCPRCGYTDDAGLRAELEHRSSNHAASAKAGK